MSAPAETLSAAAAQPPVNHSAAGVPGSSTASPPSQAAASKATSSPPLSSPSFGPSNPGPQPSLSASASASASRSTTAPPTATATTITTQASPGPSTASAAVATTPTTTTTTTTSTNLLNPTLPSQSTQLHIAEARAALVASVSNMLDSELQSRAGLLHSNAVALTKQEKDVARATEGLRRENDKLAAVARDAGRRIKELGNVQNWAEVLERDFLVLEETVRLVRRGSCSGSECSGSLSGSGSGGSGSWSGSESGGSREGSRRGSVGGGGNRREQERARNGSRRDGDGDVAMDGTDEPPASDQRNNGRALVDEAALASLTEAMATDMHNTAPVSVPGQQSIPDSQEASSLDNGKGPLLDEMEVDVPGTGTGSSEPSEETVRPPASSAGASETGAFRQQETAGAVG